MRMTRRVARIGSLSVLVVFVGLSIGVITVGAQGNSPFEAITQKLDGIAQTLDDLIAGGTPQPGTVVLRSGVVRFGQPTDALTCFTLNASDHSVTVHVRMLGSFGSTTELASTNAAFPPGFGGNLGRGGPDLVAAFFVRCEWTYEGLPGDIRGTLSLETGNTSRVALDAY